MPATTRATPNAESADDLLTAEQVAELAHVHKATVHRWAGEGHIPVAIRSAIPGGRRLFRRGDIEPILFPAVADEDVAS